VYRRVDDPNEITVWHDFDDRATAESFASSDELKAAMTEAGVVSAPNIWITDEA
jgi:quinol monooxygenase YgiN